MLDAREGALVLVVAVVPGRQYTDSPLEEDELKQGWISAQRNP